MTSALYLIFEIAENSLLLQVSRAHALMHERVKHEAITANSQNVRDVINIFPGW